jgi:hypothetical protein
MNKYYTVSYLRDPSVIRAFCISDKNLAKKEDDLFELLLESDSSDDILKMIATGINLTYKSEGMHTPKLCDYTCTVNLVSKIRAIALLDKPIEEFKCDITEFFKSAHGNFMLNSSFAHSSLTSKEYLTNLLDASFKCKDEEFIIENFSDFAYDYMRKDAYSIIDYNERIYQNLLTSFDSISTFNIFNE